MKAHTIIATDLDGTFLRNDGEISQYSQDIIRKIHHLGYLIVPTTARSTHELPQSVLETDIRYYICSNGAIIWDQYEKVIMQSYRLDICHAKTISDILNTTNAVTTIVIDGIVYSEKAISTLFLSKGMPEDIVNRILSSRTLIDSATDDMKHYDALDKLHFNFKTEPERNQAIALIPDSKYYAKTSSDETNIEVTHAQANKGLSLRVLCDILTINPKTIVCFEDNLNDIPLFNVASLRIAMTNANPALKALADTTTLYTNEEDGVAHFLEQHYNLI